MVSFKIAAHAADIGLGKPEARRRDDAISDARAVFDWDRQFELALDPDRAREYRGDALNERKQHTGYTDDGRFCTMCGPDFCSVRISRDIAEHFAGKEK